MRAVYRSEAFEVKVSGEYTDCPEKLLQKPTHYQYKVTTFDGKAIERINLRGKRSPGFDEETPPIALLAILIDHLYREHLDNQPREIALTLTHLEQALLWYQESLNKTSPRFTS